jgi:hypothetical protein
MTPFLKKVVEFLRENPDGVRVVRRLTSEDIIEVPEEEGWSGEAMLVPEPERKEFGIYEVPRGHQPTAFTHFIDGIQHSQLLYYLCVEQAFLPVVYGYIAAMVLERRDRSLHPCPELHADEEALYLPARLINTRTFQKHGIIIHDTYERVEVETASFASMLQKAGATVARMRDQLERNLAMRWIERYGAEPNCWLAVDGSISDLMREQQQRRFLRVVGISKSHRTSYLRPDWMLQVLNMPAGSRSSVFRPRRPQVEEVYSWYLRLRWQEGAAPTYGLVRVEMPPTHETLELVDTVSAWLLQETRPLSLPDPRYDRLLYPFRMCEHHLRSRSPSRVLIETAVANLAP